MDELSESQREVVASIAESLDGEVASASIRRDDAWGRFISAHITARREESIMIDELPGKRHRIEVPQSDRSGRIMLRFSYYGFMYSISISEIESEVLQNSCDTDE